MKRQDVIFPILILALCALLLYVVLSVTLLEPLHSSTNLSISFQNSVFPAIWSDMTIKHQVFKIN